MVDDSIFAGSNCRSAFHWENVPLTQLRPRCRTRKLTSLWFWSTSHFVIGGGGPAGGRGAPAGGAWPARSVGESRDTVRSARTSLDAMMPPKWDSIAV